jgi:hypothetical protein
MALIHKHTDKDWCHICGRREDKTADVWFPNNAEHDNKTSKYIRICRSCAEFIIHACDGARIETKK